MIAYDLQCENGHRFEGWFEDEQAYKKQMANGLLDCPSCGSAGIKRIPSTFAIKSGSPSSEPSDAVANISPDQLADSVRHFIDNQFENVGSDFATEALKMHYGASEPRNIRGVSTKTEEKMLEEEGISFMKIPVPPDPPSDA